MAVRRRMEEVVEVEALPWDRQGDESGKAYAAFLTYRDQGITRSGQRVVQEWTKSRSLIYRWKKQHNWDERCELWDEYLLEERNKRFRARALTDGDRDLTVADSFAAKALAILLSFEPKPGQHVKIGDAVKLYEAAMKIRRAVIGNKDPNERAIEHVQVIVEPYPDEEVSMQHVPPRQLGAKSQDEAPPSGGKYVDA